MFKNKKIIKIVITLVSIVVLYVVSMFVLIISSNRIMIYKNKGLFNWFQKERYTYYAVMGNLEIRVPGAFVKQACPEGFTFDNDMSPKDDSAAKYYVNVFFDKDGHPEKYADETISSKKSIDLSHDDTYFISYSKVGNDKDSAPEEVQKVMLDISAEICKGSGDTDTESSVNLVDDQGITEEDFTLICYDEGYLITGAGIWSCQDGKLKKDTCVPNNNSLQYCIWKKA